MDVISNEYRKYFIANNLLIEIFSCDIEYLNTIKRQNAVCLRVCKY